MKKKKLKCLVCGGIVVYNDIEDIFACTECNATHASDLYKDQKVAKGRYRLRKIKILVAILATLYALYFFFRFAAT